MNSKITVGIRRLADALTTKNVLRLVGVFAAVFALFLIPATAGAAGGIVSTLSDTFYTLISHALYWLAYGLGKVTVVLFGVLVQVAQYNDFIHAEAVRLGWVILRDIANMLFILVLLVIAFGTAFRIQQYRYTVLLRQLIIMAVLINFSLSITGFFIDITQVVTLTFVNAFADTAAGNLTTAVGLDKVLRLDPNVPAAEVTNLSIAATLLLGVIFIAVTAVVTVLYVVIFLTRIVALWLLAIMSPIAYLANVFPSTKQYWGRWWKTFWNYALVGPLLAFFLWLTLSVTQAGNSALQIVNTDEKSTFESGVGITSTISEIGSQAGILSFLVAILLLVMSLKMATEFGVAGSRWAQASFDKVQKNAANISRAAAKGAAGGLYRVTAQGMVEKGALGVTSRLARTRLPFLNEAALGWNARLSGYQAKRAKGQEDLLNSVQDERIIEKFANSTEKDPLSDARRRIAQKMAPGSIKVAAERAKVLQNMNPADFRSVRANRMHRLALQFGSDHITDLYPDLARAVVQGGTENQKTALGLKGVAYDRRKNSFLFPAPPGSPAGTPPSTTGPRPTPEPPLGYQPNKPFADVDRTRYNETREVIRQRFGNNPEAFFQSPEYKLNAARFVGHDDFLEAFEGQQERQRKIERGETRLDELTGIRTATAKGGRGEGATLALDFAEGRSLGLNLGNAAGLNLSAAEKQKAAVALSGKYRQQETEKEVARRHKEMQESADRDYEQQRSEAQQRGEGEAAQRRLVTEDEAVAAVQADVAFQGQLATKTQDFRSALQNAKSLRLINKGRVGRAPKRILRHEKAHDAVAEMDPKELKALWDQLDADRQQEIEQYVRQNWPDGAAMTPEQIREEFFSEVMANSGRKGRLGPLELVPEEQKEKYLSTKKTIEEQFDGNVKAFYRSKQYRDNPLQYLQQQDVERAAREEQILQQLADSKTLNSHERAMTGVAALPDDGIEAAWGVLPEERQQELEDYLAESSDQLNFLRRGDNRARFEASRRMIAETYGGNHRAFFDSNEFRKNKKAFLNEKDFWRGDEELLALKKEALGEMLASFNGATNEGPINFADSEKDIALLLRASAEKKRLLTVAPARTPSGARATPTVETAAPTSAQPPLAPPLAGSQRVSASPPERVVERRFEAPISPIVTTNVINNTTVKSVAGELSQRLEGQIGALPMRDMLYSLQRMQDTILQVARQQGIEAKELAGINGEIDRLKADVRRPEKTRKEDEALHANLRTFLKKIHGRGSDDDASDSDSNDEPTMAA